MLLPLLLGLLEANPISNPFPLTLTGSYWFLPVQILHYSPEEGEWVAPGPFLGLIAWNGSRGTRDLQDLSVWLAEVRHAHAGQYVCRLKRNLTFEGYTYSLARNQTLRLAVVEKARRDLASIVSEILMYVLIVVLTLWL
ncbi:sodium channel subunit beta-1-like, partial [Geospiza fortis]|uniref:Sodium channel subunit beta-1-like n=1 Tax=Geospiza fortis TaxID=48883 RepID=A0A8N5F360_GEOFO